VGFDRALLPTAGDKKLMRFIISSIAVPVCPRLPDGQGQAGMAGLYYGVKRNGFL